MLPILKICHFCLHPESILPAIFGLNYLEFNFEVNYYMVTTNYFLENHKGSNNMNLFNGFVIKDKKNESKPSERSWICTFHKEHTTVLNDDSLFLTKYRSFYDFILCDKMFIVKYRLWPQALFFDWILHVRVNLPKGPANFCH